jgi:hypothetical protein
METREQAQEAIISALKDFYFKGIYLGSAELLSEVFHPGTLLFADIEGEPYAKTLDDYLDGVSSRISPRDSGKPFVSEIISIEAMNSIAVAKVHIKMYAFNYYDLLSFHNIGGKWLIVNKMFTHVAE